MRTLFAALLSASFPVEPVDYAILLKERANRWEAMSYMFIWPGDEVSQAYMIGRRDGLLEAEAVIRYERWKLTN